MILGALALAGRGCLSWPPGKGLWKAESPGSRWHPSLGPKASSEPESGKQTPDWEGLVTMQRYPCGPAGPLFVSIRPSVGILKREQE